MAAMKKPSTSFGTRAWRLLRLAVLWARKGGAAQAQHSLRLLRTLRRHGHGLGLGGNGRRGDRLRHGGELLERQFSIDETPAFRFRTPSARVLRLIPCFAPETPGLYGGDDHHRYFFTDAAAREVVDDDEEGAAGYYCYGNDPRSVRAVEEEEPSCCGGGDDEQLLERVVAEACRASTAGSVAGDGGEDAGIDVRAEEFIARFHAQMKLQRQISWLQYNEMMQRSIS